MELVLAHRNMDFDCLACQVAVSKLYPAARIVPAHPISQRIRSFLSLYRNLLPVVDLQYVDWQVVKHVYVVDCQKLDRLDDRARRLFKQYSSYGPFTIFDHHETDADSLLSLASTDSIVKETGAAASILVERLKDEKISLSSFEATVIAAGIYEDTGCLTHRGTTELDASAIAYCLKQGADLERINHIIRPKFDAWQASLYERLLAASESIELGAGRLTISTGASDHYIDGLSEIASRLLETSATDALVCVVEMKDRVHIVARSESNLFDLRILAQHFGGGGHSGAASAVVKGAGLGETRDRVLECLHKLPQNEKCAAEIMASPVRTIKQEISMDEAGRIMLRYNTDGLVVMEKHEIAGIVSNRDVDKARHHKLGHAPVRGFMSHPVITVQENIRISEIQSLMTANDIGRLPVLDERNRLIGIVGRRELLSALYGEELEIKQNLFKFNRQANLESSELTSRIAPDLLELYKQLGSVAAELDMVAYLVGGCVRDLILKRENFDIDFVVEGSASRLAHALVENFPETYELIVEHTRFDTATLRTHKFPQREIDIATARTEYYEYPAALPTVEPSSLEQDLYRRDFTINALALCIHPERFGQIVDFFSGMHDLKAGLIRILHTFSFIEDPTRIVRAIRFATRLGFRLEAKTRRQAERAIALDIFDNLGGVRLKEELRMILESDQRIQALDLLNDLGGGLKFLDTSIKYDRQVRLHLRRAQKLLATYPLAKPYVVYLGILFYCLTDERLRQATHRLHLADEDRSWISDARSILAGIGRLPANPKRSAIFRVLNGHNEHALAIAVCVAPLVSHLRRCIKIYFDELKELKPKLRGRDLIELGIPEGPQIGKILEDLQNECLDGLLQSITDEKEYVKKHYPELISKEKTAAKNKTAVENKDL